jgi:hypothetical protein
MNSLKFRLCMMAVIFYGAVASEKSTEKLIKNGEIALSGYKLLPNGENSKVEEESLEIEETSCCACLDSLIQKLSNLRKD